MTIRSAAVVVGLALTALIWACAEFTIVTAPATGTLAVPVVMDSGVPPDSGFVVAVDDTITRRVHPPDTVMFTLYEGDHTVELRYVDGTAVGSSGSATIQHLVMRK